MTESNPGLGSVPFGSLPREEQIGIVEAQQEASFVIDTNGRRIDLWERIHTPHLRMEHRAVINPEGYIVDTEIDVTFPPAVVVVIFRVNPTTKIPEYLTIKEMRDGVMMETFIQGHLQYGERPHEGAVREADEEGGIDLSTDNSGIVKEQKIIRDATLSKDTIGVVVYKTSAEINPIASLPDDSEDIISTQWVNPEALAEKIAGGEISESRTLAAYAIAQQYIESQQEYRDAYRQPPY